MRHILWGELGHIATAASSAVLLGNLSTHSRLSRVAVGVGPSGPDSAFIGIPTSLRPTA